MTANPYGAPGVQAAADDPSLDDPAASQPSTIGKVAGVVAIMAGATLATGAVQLATIFYLRPREYVVDGLMLVAGLALMALGPSVMQSRRNPTVLATMLSAIGGLLTGGWWLYAFVYGGALSLLLMFGVPMSVLAVIFGVLAIGPSVRVTAARARLYQ